MERSYTVGQIKRYLQESAQEFKPVIGNGVQSENKANNEKTYKETEKKVKDYDGGLTEPKKNELGKKPDGNRTTLDYNPIVEPDKEYKDKVNAQAEGYTSKMEKENGIEKNAEFDNDGKIAKQFKDSAKERNEIEETLANSGIQGQNLPKQEKNTLAESEILKPKRLTFSHTKFINESQMLQKLPEEYKKDGQTIYMKDREGNEYIVECVKNEFNGLIETNVKGYMNEAKEQAQLSRIQQLFEYDSSKEFGKTTTAFRKNESDNFGKLMEIARNK